MKTPSLTRFAWLSIAAALATMALKALAYWLTLEFVKWGMTL
jgi:divalent metal cation (Fe/Co/Zn/Cd) transporter